MNKFGQLKLLIWKNFLIQKKHKLGTIFEIFLPIVMVVVLVVIRNFIKSEEMCTMNPAHGGYCDYALFTPALFPLVPPCQNISCSLKVAYAPGADPRATTYMRAIENYYGLEVRGFDNDSTLESFLKEENDRHSNSFSHWIGGVVFNTSQADKVEYSIRMDAVPRLANHTEPPVKDWRTRWVYPVFQVIGPREILNSFGGDPGYFREGFLALQHAIDRAIIMESTNKFPEPIVMKRMPYPKFDMDNFIYVIENTFPFLFLIAFTALNINSVRAVVTEKEKRIKEAMKIMGLTGWVHWAGWYIETMMVMMIPIVIITVVMSLGKIIIWSDPTLIFFFIFTYVLASVSFSFLISTLFSRANVAAGAAGVFWFMSYSPYFFLLQFYENMTAVQKLSVSLFSNTAMGIASKVIAAHEAAQIGVQWEDFLEDKNTGDIPFGSIILVLIGDTILYSLLAWYIESVFPGEFGTPRKFYFFLTPSYWGFCRDDNISNLITNETTPLVTDSSSILRSAYHEDVPPNLDPVIDIRGLSKQYPGADVMAVDNLNLRFFKGQIFALLGHNGAGKTTTISLLTGLYPASKGEAYVNGRDIRTSIGTIRKQIGFCPQYNVVFEELTVEQHLIFFATLKEAGNRMRYEVDSMITALGLEDKRHQPAKNLSGGMKRKLSVANALVGNSKIVFLDEPTAGMDPAARRSTWDLLLRYKQDKTIILTTHHMDEADLLGDRIGIMAKGSLYCVGSSMFLKKQFGIGYHMTVVKHDSFITEIFSNFVTSYIAGSKMEGNVAAEVSFLLPEDQVCNFERFFTDLEREQDNLGVETYGLSLTTLEEVFMRVEEMGRDEPASPNKIANEIFSKARKNVSELLRGAAVGDLSVQSREEAERVGGRRSRAVQIRDHFNQGYPLTLQQLYAMLVKRCYYSLRNIKTLLMQLLMPVFFTMIVLIVIKKFPSLEDAPALNLTVLEKNNMFSESRIIYQPPHAANSSFNKLMSAVNTLVSPHTEGVEKVGDMTTFVLNKIHQIHGHFNKQYIMGFSTLANLPNNQEVTTLWFNNRPYHTIPILLNLYTNAYLSSEGSRMRVSVTNRPLLPSTSEKVSNINDQIIAFIVAFNVMFGFAFLASSFVIFIVKERISGTRHLMMLSGLNPTIYWVSTILWDMFNFLLPSLLMLVLFSAFDVPPFTGDNLPTVLLLELLYGWAVIPLMYLMGRLFKNEVLAYTRLIMLNIITGTGACLVVFILSIPQLGLLDVSKTLKWVFLLLPNFNLGQGLGDMFVNYVIKQACTKDALTRFGCELQHIVWQENYMAWESPGIGRYLVFLTGLGVIFFSILLVVEYLSVNEYRQKLSAAPAPFVPDPLENLDVKGEREAVSKSTLTDYAVRIENLTKTYSTSRNKELTAVDHLSIGIPSRETFGLLGVNGAGKTSTFKMLTGDLPISSGTATICGYDVTSEITTARRFIGYCPQFDSLIDCMTPREHLMMYARLRGVPEAALVAIVERTLNELGLLAYADYYSAALSGGNKRKLSTALALVGYPPVVFLDEPTAGLDVAARRALWDVVSRVRKLGTAIILTSHSMEECEALCTRLAIMVNGQLKCIGTLQELKSKYGAGYNVQVKVETNADGEPDGDALRGFIRCHFPEARLEEEHSGLLSYIIPKSGSVTWAAIFSLLEQHKEQARIQDYSVSQTTLEQVFLSFAKSQRLESEAIKTE